MHLSCFPVEFWIFSAFFDNDQIKISNVMVLRIEMYRYSLLPLVSYISQMLFYSFRYCPLGLPDIYYFLAFLTVYSVNCVCCLTVRIFLYLFNFRNFYIFDSSHLFINFLILFFFNFEVKQCANISWKYDNTGFAMEKRPSLFIFKHG